MSGLAVCWLLLLVVVRLNWNEHIDSVWRQVAACIAEMVAITVVRLCRAASQRYEAAHVDEPVARSQGRLNHGQPSAVGAVQTSQLARLDGHVEPQLTAHLELQEA